MAEIILQPIIFQSFDQFQKCMNSPNELNNLIRSNKSNLYSEENATLQPPVEAEKPTSIAKVESKVKASQSSETQKTELKDSKVIAVTPQSSRLKTIAKMAVAGSLIAGFGYGMFWLGAAQAAEVAGKAFENFVETTANMMPQTREDFYQAMRETMTVVRDNAHESANTLIGSGNSVMDTTGGSAIVSLGTSAISTFGEKAASLTGYVPEGFKLSFNGELRKAFAADTLKHVKAPNLNIVQPIKDTLNVVIDKANDVIFGIKYGGLGIGLAAGGWGLNKLAAPIKFAVNLYSYTAFPGAQALRSALG